jgi:two-component system chemotaxis sensor kinase CheA
VIKSLESNYKRVEGISGATILGDGTVSLILDIAGVVKMAERLNTDSKEAAA